jgi:hypothetical protein
MAVWSQSPPPSNYEAINWDLRSDEIFEPAIQAVLEYPLGTVVTKLDDTRCFIIQPIHPEIGADEVVALVIAEFNWKSALEDLFVSNATEILMVEIRNTCQQAIVFEISGSNVQYVENNVPEKVREKDIIKSVDLSTMTDKTKNPQACQYSMQIYGTQTANEENEENRHAKVAAIAIAAAFAFLSIAFIGYNNFVRNKFEQLRLKAERSNAIVESMFPEMVRDKILQDEYERFTSAHNSSSGTSKQTKTTRKPLADLFLETTVLYADIVGFTAWSSVREPFQVFTLLETLFSEFDNIANKRKIFKVSSLLIHRRQLSSLLLT